MSSLSISAGDDPPRNIAENVQYRLALDKRMNEESGFRHQIMLRASTDLCFFVDALGWTYQAKPFPMLVPMLLYPLQTRYMRLLQQDGGRRHFHLDKSRDMGLTWCSLFWIFWHWLFTKGAKFHLASWKEWLVDQKGHPGTHFAKLDHMLAYLPESVRPNVRRGHERRKMFMQHPGHNAVITGESTTRRMGHQDRNMAALLDEFALMGERPQDGYAILGGIRPTTDCMILQSTPCGMGNAFADYKLKAHNQSSFWWPDHPQKGAGLSGPGLTEKPKSGFWSDNVEGLRDRLTSPWFEQQCQDAVNEQEIAQEIQIDYCGSGWQYFSELLLRRILLEDAMEPLHEGDLIVQPDSGECKGFLDKGKGPLKLWIHLNDKGFPSREFDYVVGADIAAGSRDSQGAGWSNSCAVVMNLQTGEVVAELVVHGMDAADFAVLTISLCHFFHKAYHIWEGNGVGIAYGHTVTDRLRYGNIYYRKQEKKITNEETKEPGFWTTPYNQQWLITNLYEALDKHYVTERSKLAVKELRMYQETPQGAVHAIAASTPDPTGARANHADRVVARLMAYHGMVDRGYNPLGGDESVSRRIIPANSIAALREYDSLRETVTLGY